MVLTLSKDMLEKYFGVLSRFDSSSKKKLIEKLQNSIHATSEKSVDLGKLFGAWEDEKTSDEIIEEIKASRINSPNRINFK